MQQPDIEKICPVPTLPWVPTPTSNSRLWASPQPRFSSAHSVLTSLLRLRLWRPLRRTNSGAPPHLTDPHFQLRPARSRILDRPRPRPSSRTPTPGLNRGPGTLPGLLAPALASSAPPLVPATRQLPAGPARPTQEPRSQSAAATMRPERG